MVAARTTRDEQRARTRQGLLTAAAGLFADRGFGAVSTARVAEAAGVSHGTVFAHFATREALVEAVIAELAARLGAELHAMRGTGRTLPETLRAHLRVLSDHEALYRRLVAEENSLPRAARASLVTMQALASHHILEVLEREQGEGLARECSGSFAFSLWVGVIHHYLANADLFAPGRSVIEARGDELVSAFTELLRP